MRIIKCIPILIVAALIAVAAVPSNAQAQNGNRELLGEFDFTDPLIGWFPGINGGEGEEASTIGYYYFWGKVKESKSGNVKEQGYLTGWEYVTGLETGDVWYGIMEKAPILWHYGKDGSYFLHEPVHMIYYKLDENGELTDERVRAQWRYHIMIDGDGNIKAFDTSLLHWHYYPPK